MLIRAQFITVLLCLFPWQLWSNGVSLSALNIDDQHTLTASLQWEHSWYYPESTEPGNHDAVWIFCKGMNRISGEWQHVLLDSPAEVSAADMEVMLSSDRRGALVKRAEFGEGHVEAMALNVTLDIAALSDYSAFRLFATELVYVPEGAFYLGDSTSNNTLINYSDNTPYYIDNERSIEVGESNGQLWTSQDFPPAGDIPNDFPKGFEGFYMMKYEISQEQYADFLNTLTTVQQTANRLSTIIEAPCFAGDHIEGERNYIIKTDEGYGCDANGNGILNEVDDGQHVACNFLTWSNITAYLDWSGMRPMSELEYEKACRGPKPPIPFEFAFGAVNTINTSYPVDLGSASEVTADTIPPGYGISNFGYCQPSGPMRCGFAANAQSDRLSSGAGYFGAMELSGNLWELCVPLTEAGLQFTGEHGDGRLDPDGSANVANWLSGGHRGGGWNSGVQEGFRDLAISDRFFVYLDPDDQAKGTVGGRGVISKSRFE